MSYYAALRTVSTSLKSAYRYDDGATRTFASDHTAEFLDHHPYIKYKREFQDWTPHDILRWFITNTMDAWWQTKVEFFIDPQALLLVPRDVVVYKWIYDEGSQLPVLTATTTKRSAIGDQVFRLTTWGQLIDFIAQIMPGVHVYENIAAEKNEIYFTTPARCGFLDVRVGLGNDFRDDGADITDLTNDTDNTETINRVAVYGQPAECTVTVMSEIDGDIPYSQLGLVPDWPLFDVKTLEYETDPEEFIGCSAFDYETNEYSQTVTTLQTISKVLENPLICQPGEADYIEGYEYVGRRWRLPNWFEKANIARGGDLLVNASTGDMVNHQLFVEVAVARETDDAEAPVDYQYEWRRWEGGLDFDWKNKRITLEECPTTEYLVLREAPLITAGCNTPEHSLGRKLCRIALTFTYSIGNFVPYADTFIEDGLIIDESRLTGLATGNALVFERNDLGYAQVTNLNMPLYMQYRELAPSTPELFKTKGGAFYQEAAEETAEVFHDEIVISTKDQNGEVIHIHTGPLAKRKYTGEVFEEPSVLRDDTAQLHKVAKDMLEIRGKRARKFGLSLGLFTKAVMRGLICRIGNLNSNYSPDLDAVDTVLHNLRTGMTSFTTTNQPGSSLNALMISRDIETDG